ncbi:hypothetical protein ACHAWF_012147, partial [Thalassiosira exigua]
SPSRHRGRRYSYDQSLVHFVVLNSEHDLALGSEQHEWLVKDLGSVDRNVTPWIVVELHRPLYARESDWLDATVSEGLQDEVEDVLFAHDVDLVLSGHRRTYFRSCDGLYANGCGNDGPTYVTVGTGGAPLDGGTDGSTSTTTKFEGYVEVADGKRWGVGRASVHNAVARSGGRDDALRRLCCDDRGRNGKLEMSTRSFAERSRK